ncbi:MAG: metalloregulator ArsR/SmtB family transcription factor [Maricaulis sp.]|uniref:metalloregulator ArsR/SmtB family transcription factor n=1 Tax=Maricaulis sp. TaxID=1486257 RepID=UPI001B1C9E55|nr:metalloregulator ArsR/SmtB family transcription factor [Maricaulis sp.]MBO6697070.1 winged helix-turn-helix transcriptional regulator [Henriciella sp.]MBO6728768.1 winged helix-turn-helix transcriptional regulator [Maricaulis sp.]MBO6846289.1 winged helix-turn-helix transcriptional regulator [Maricaulis sp.]MBO6875834.1 winged helix-turn-helix transcriptional regulator [Maricaulis sp.]MDM7984313.1 metalloregulator ArsR/SmtB family transcription factor [Maricaulis sp.]
MADVFKALAHPVRRQVLRDLRDGPCAAGELAARFPVSKPTMSGHFNILKDAGLILAERHGTTIRYRLNVSVADEAIGWLMELVTKDEPEASEGETE